MLPRVGLLLSSTRGALQVLGPEPSEAHAMESEMCRPSMLIRMLQLLLSSQTRCQRDIGAKHAVSPPVQN